MRATHRESELETSELANFTYAATFSLSAASNVERRRKLAREIREFELACILTMFVSRGCPSQRSVSRINPANKHGRKVPSG